MSDTIRAVKKSDLESLKKVIETSGLFPSEMLADMLADYFENSNTLDVWFTKTINNEAIAVAFCAPEKLTDGTYNLYLIAVHQEYQGQGFGSELIQYVENWLKSQKKRILLVETSGLPEFELTRKFYDKCNYTREAVIRDFYREGDDKVVFWKKIN